MVSLKYISKGTIAVLCLIVLYLYIVVPFFIVFVYGSGVAGYANFENSIWKKVLSVLLPLSIFFFLYKLYRNALKKNDQRIVNSIYVLSFISLFFILFDEEIVELIVESF